MSFINKITACKIDYIGDHAIQFSFEEKMDEKIIAYIMQLKKGILDLHLNFVLDLIPSFNTLTLVYDITLFYQHKTALKYNHSMIEMAKTWLTKLETTEISHKKSKTEIIKIPVCYDLKLGIDLENLSLNKNIAIDEIIQKHCEEVYLVYCLGFLPGFAYMGKINPQIQMPRHSSPRKEVIAGSVGIAGEQTGIYPMNSPGGWQIIGRTPIKIFDANPSVLAKLEVGNRIQFYPISYSDFEKLNEYN